MTRILESREKDGLSDVQIAAHASDFVIAGSETTATALACVSYYLQRNPEALQKLRQEIRTSFSTYEEVTASSTVSLKYLNAVLLEGMRMYPPLPFALPRVVPQGGDTVGGHFLPGGVSETPLFMVRKESNYILIVSIDCGIDQSICSKHVLRKLQRPMGFQTRALAWFESRRYLGGKPAFFVWRPVVSWTKVRKYQPLVFRDKPSKY